MAVRCLIAVAALAVVYGCGQVSSPADKQETTQGGVEETQPKTVTDGCLGEYSQGEYRIIADLNYSPAGEKIVFQSYYYYETYDSASASPAPGTGPDEADSEICVVNADGTGMVNLTDNSDDEQFAAWSPDGTKIAFTRSLNSDDEDIFVMNSDGSNETKLQDSGHVNGLTWSPDGQQVAFGANSKFYIMRADGSGTPRLLTSDPAWQYAVTPAWSPDGKWLAFQSERDTERDSIGDPADIYIMQVGNTDQWQQLTDGSAHDLDPAWSPDGTEIAFNRTEMIYKVNTADSKETRLIRGEAPTWAPDGNHIAYIGQDGGIYVMDSDGSDQTLVVGDAVGDAP